MRQFATDLFNNGSQGKVLKKNSDANMDFGWGEGGGSFPAGGQNGYVLTKNGDNARWSNPGSLFPRMDIVYVETTEKNTVARIDRMPISRALEEGSLSASFANDTLTLVITNDSDDSIDVWFDLFFDSGNSDYVVGTISSQVVTAVGPVVWNCLEVTTTDFITIAAGESETITIAITDASGFDTNNVYTFTFPD